MRDSVRKHIDVEYLDIDTCARCKGTNENLSAALQMAQTLLQAMDADVTVRRILVDSEEKAQAVGLVSSPTIRINGRDIATELKESRCEDCSDLCGCSTGTNCRVWRYKGEDYEVAPVPVLLDAILSAFYSEGNGGELDVSSGSTVPENLKKFYAAQRKEKEPCCTPEESENCCAPEAKESCCGSGVEESEPVGVGLCGCR